MKTLPQIETTYDVVSGISAGNLNGALLSTYELDDQEGFINQAMTMWHSIGFEDILKFWPGGFAEGLLFRSSIFKNDALKRTITQATEGKTFKRIFTAGATDTNEARFIEYTYRPGQQFDSHAIDSCLASAAIPAIFPPI